MTSNPPITRGQQVKINNVVRWLNEATDSMNIVLDNLIELRDSLPENSTEKGYVRLLAKSVERSLRDINSSIQRRKVEAAVIKVDGDE